MQTITAHFLIEEMPEIREAISKMDNIEILSEHEFNGGVLIMVTLLTNDPATLFSVGQLVQYERMAKIINAAESDVLNDIVNKLKP